MKKYATKGKNTLGNVINYFYVDDKGVYSSYPSSINDELEKENFDSFRELFNNASINDYRVVKAKDDYLLYTRLYKIRKNSELVGILGINIKLGTLANDINKIFGDGEARKVFEVRENGNLYSKYYNELYENINNKYYKDNLIYKFKDDKTALVLGEKSGAVKEAKKLDAVRYLHFRDMDKTKIDFVRIDVERE